LTGRHEPETTGSFYFSLATAALRGALVVAAVVLGVFVLSRAFPSTGEVTPSAPTETPTGQATPGGEETGGGGMASPPAEQQTEEAPPPEEVTLQVLNGTDVDGLAAETADLLEAEGYRIDNIDDANQSYDVTTLFFHPRSEAAAVALQADFFPDAQLEEGARDLAVDVSVILGSDYAAAQEEAA
jgi:LytR cell envelope-related transcriptional attenuator